MKKGARKLGEIRDRMQERQLERARRDAERQKVYTAQYNAQAAMYRAAAAKENARQSLRQASQGSNPFGGGYGLQNPFAPPVQRQAVKVVYRSKPKKRKRTMVRYVQQKQRQPNIMDLF